MPSLLAPQTIASPQVTGSSASISGASSSLPPKLIKKILELEFVDMSELVPDMWRFPDVDDNKCCHHSRCPPKRGQVTDILLWIEHFSTLVGILTTKYQTYAPGIPTHHCTCQSLVLGGRLGDVRSLLSACCCPLEEPPLATGGLQSLRDVRRESQANAVMQILP